MNKQDLKRKLQSTGLLRAVNQIRMFGKPHATAASIMNFPTFGEKVNRSIAHSRDYFRHATMALAFQRVINENIEGSIAEIGVYRGETSKFLHNLAPERPYYLFDTFEGFPEQDLEQNGKNDQRFRDTSIESVLATIGDVLNVHPRKGYVPDTFTGLEQLQFAFVLIDLDLYAPTVSSLEFFYPRVSRGGYIIVHDYNSPESNWACKRAVDEFMNDKPEFVIEIADNWGSVLFRKL
ncbi:MAG: class I SAM-dependent methyltransferase [Ignavibacteria bacterium]|nr:class I SAM-dependent methyltransferase [Ignavibacteria bacterium]